MTTTGHEASARSLRTDGFPDLTRFFAARSVALLGVPFATVFSSGFSETGTDEGRRLQQRIVDVARAFGLLEGAHGQPAGDIAALAECIVRLSWLAIDLQDLISELEVNPLRVLPQGRGVLIVDARIIASANTAGYNSRQPGATHRDTA